MKKFVLSLLVAAFTHTHMYAQENFNAVFPIINSTVKDAPVYVGAFISESIGYMGFSNHIADEMSVYVGGEQCKYVTGSFLSFRYVSRKNAKVSDEWGMGAEATQLAFYPSGINTGKFSPYTPTGVPLYAFECKSGVGLRLIDLSDMSVIAVLDTESDQKKFVNLTVFAGAGPGDKDIIVVAGWMRFKIFETIPGTGNGIKAVSADNGVRAYYDMNGVKHDQPTKGVNIVVDGTTSKKIVNK